MRAVVQRVSSASVTAGDYTASIHRGVLVLVGVERGDGPDDVDYVARKIREIRMFTSPDDAGKEFDKSVHDVGGELLVVSQFTLAADCRKGRRPSFDDAAPPQVARPLYEEVVRELQSSGVAVATGTFQ